jgi:hypothetical protein
MSHKRQRPTWAHDWGLLDLDYLVEQREESARVTTAMVEQVKRTGRVDTLELYLPESGDSYASWFNSKNLPEYFLSWEQMQATERGRDAVERAQRQAMAEAARERARAQPPPQVQVQPGYAQLQEQERQRHARERQERIQAQEQFKRRARLEAQEAARRRERLLRVYLPPEPPAAHSPPPGSAAATFHATRPDDWPEADLQAAAQAQARWVRRSVAYQHDQMARITVSDANVIEVLGVVFVIEPATPVWLPYQIARHCHWITEAWTVRL